MPRSVIDSGYGSSSRDKQEQRVGTVSVDE
jgi:hypothetical protein